MCISQLSYWLSILFNSWSANQVIGEPNVYPRYGDLTGTWASAGFVAEWIEVNSWKHNWIECNDNNWIWLFLADKVNDMAADVLATKEPGKQQPWYWLWTQASRQVLLAVRTISTTYAILMKHNMKCKFIFTLQWRHNERNGVSNHRCLNCLLNRFFRCRSKKTSKIRLAGLCGGNSPVTGEFPRTKGQ